MQSDPWYLTALDFRSGRTLFKFKAGQGLGFNNNYAPVTIGPDGTAYVGTLGGIVAMRDATPPPRIAQTRDGRPPNAPPRVKLRLRYGKGGSCSHRAARVSVYGRDVKRVKRVQFRLGRRVVGHRPARPVHPPHPRGRRAPRRERPGARAAGRRPAHQALPDGPALLARYSRDCAGFRG